MIIVRLKGGLGNQMFQYAAGCSLADLHKTELKLDTSYIEQSLKADVTLRTFGLDVFNIDTGIATKEEVDPFFKNAGSRLYRVAGRMMPQWFNNLYIAESGSKFHKKFNSYPKNTYLDGYWQSELYFKNIKNIIRNTFSIKNLPEGKNVELIEKMNKANSVSIHIRRNDYVSEPSVINTYANCSLHYYTKGIEYIEWKTKNIELFIFSDDIVWCKENLKFNHPCTFIEHNTGKYSFEDMRLMSNCKHNIIANSSFSWWGAWLNPHPNKIVVAPQKWFIDPKMNSNDLVPKEWMRI